jgi:hypothetical protein
MNELQRQVRIAARRLTVQQFLVALPWTLTAALLLAALAILVPKFWPLPNLPVRWDALWLGGAISIGILAAGLHAWLRRRSGLQAALEIDARFGLKERLSSCLALTPETEQTPAGQALLADATRRIERLDVRHAFRVQPSKWSWVPACCGLLAFAFTLLADAVPEAGAGTQTASAAITKRVQNASELLKKQIEENRQEAVEKGLPDAKELMERLERGADAMARKDRVDQQQALVKLNELAREVQQKQRQLGDTDRMKQQLDALRDMQQGPAERLGKAMSSGDLNQAMRELQQLQSQMNQGQWSDEEKQQLAQQFAAMKEKLEQMAATQERSRREMQQQRDQLDSQGDRERAAELQRKLDELASQERQSQQANEMAKQLDQSAQALRRDDPRGAATELNALNNSLSKLQADMDEQKLLEKTSNQIAQAKDAMNCKQCEGKGCESCQGQNAKQSSQNASASKAGGQAGGRSAGKQSATAGKAAGNGSMASRGTGKQGQGQGGQGQGGQGQGTGQGQGLGQGRGQGARPESPTDTDFQDSQVPANSGPGQTVIAGKARGPNQAGQAIEEIKAEVEANQRSQEDPLTGQRLPKPQRQLTREYFDAIREGK